MYFIDPSQVYSEADLVQGKIPTNGARGYNVAADGTTGEFISCKVSAGNVGKGMVVNISSTYTCAVISAGGGPRADRTPIGVACCSTTASVSANIWVQVYGRSNVIASTSCIPNNVLIPAAVATGGVDDGTSSLSACLEGIVTLASTNAASTLVAAWLQYPRWVSGNV